VHKIGLSNFRRHYNVPRKYMMDTPFLQKLLNLSPLSFMGSPVRMGN